MNSRRRRAARWLVAGTLGILGACSAGSGAWACHLNAPGYRGPVSAHFDGESFKNQVPMQMHTLLEVAQWRLFESDAPDWTEQTEREPRRPPDARVHDELRATFVNHATVLIQMDGVNILTDPVYSDHVGPFGPLGPRRFRPAGVDYADLPPIDIVLISHNHYDHMDVPTLRRLAADHRPLIMAGLGSRALLEAEGIGGAEDIDWWQSRIFGALKITSAPVQHWSRRGWDDHQNTLWTGYVIEGPGGPVYFPGDTGWGPHFEQTFERFGPMRLALLPIGAYEPRWFMKQAHLSPSEAVDAAVVLRAKTSIGIHWGTFQLGDEGQDEPGQRVVDYLSGMDAPPRFLVIDNGEHRVLPPL